MRNILFGLQFILALAGLAACHTATENLRSSATGPNVGAGSTFTAMSYNIRLGIGRHPRSGKIYDKLWGHNLAALIDEVRSVKPDIVGLQEVAAHSQAKNWPKP